MQEIFYICKHGCRVKLDGIMFVKKGADLLKRCSEHGAQLSHREATCTWVDEDGTACGKVFKASKTGFVSLYCPEHRAEIIRRQSREAKRKHSTMEIPQKNSQKVNCPFLGKDQLCGKVCIADHFGCVILENMRVKVAA